MYAISFAREQSYRRAIEEGPWSVMGCPIQFQKWVGSDLISEMNFSSIQY